MSWGGLREVGCYTTASELASLLYWCMLHYPLLSGTSCSLTLPSVKLSVFANDQMVLVESQ
ncbi:hypothetical protein GBAR_LOCUS13488 [Geodia barretti]|uniref:Uncharacterized protein n=1 Tax=Geodia barretti TaxID=519541 RepID=A0AA35S5J3_GEOBA|nr:hypothetical protein GBAR_LOCUS13488 [Geodia barretti]